MARHLTFAELEVGEAFLFLTDPHVDVAQAGGLTFRIKTSTHRFESHATDGEVSDGRVGVGDNPVRRVAITDSVDRAERALGVQ